MPKALRTGYFKSGHFTSAAGSSHTTMDFFAISLSDLISIAGIVISLYIAVWSNNRLRKTVELTLDIDVRKTIERLERNKEHFKTIDPAAYKELFDVQEELESMSFKLRKVFGLPPHRGGS